MYPHLRGTKQYTIMSDYKIYDKTVVIKQHIIGINGHLDRWKIIEILEEKLYIYS